MFENDEITDSDKFFTTLPRPLKLLFALYNMMVSKSEMLCYFVIILNHMVSASLLSLVLPILIFLWAMLSVPRPSKRFWMTAIIYTEVCWTSKIFFISGQTDTGQVRLCLLINDFLVGGIFIILRINTPNTLKVKGSFIEAFLC